MAIDSPETSTPSPEGRLTHCPTCGMKIARDDLSLCSYCGAPVGLGEEKARISELQKRLGKMPDHKNYEAAMAWQPPESQAFVAGKNDQSRAKLVNGVAVVLILWGAFAVNFFLLFLGFAALLGSAYLWRRGAQRCKEATTMPLLKRAAIVHERRSETAFQGATGETVYFFQIEFADGGQGEFRQPGRGAQFEPLVNGNTGIAYTRGQELLDFKVLRV